MKRKLFKVFIAFFLITTNFYSQNNGDLKNRLSDNLLLGVSGNMNYLYSDYLSTKPTPGMQIIFDYIFPSRSFFTYGVGVYGGLSNLTAERIHLIAPPIVDSKVLNGGIGIKTYFRISPSLYFYGGGGLSFMSVTAEPKNSEPSSDFSSFSTDVESGLKIYMSERISLNISGGLHFVFNDNLDNLIVGTHNDFFVSTNVGIQYALTKDNDIDGDGIPNDKDLCSDEAEDIDGFQDDDGCPDYDNDKDGILDEDDDCINSPEDIDGFNDWDGCPDLDDDEDSVIDSLDECPDLKEDLDGFEDDDGCPDYDNDKDGIPDSLDGCPNTPEDLDGFEDGDGCPEIDNDKDGIPDLQDDCPDQAEVVNGYNDLDGCPDSLVNDKTSSKQLIMIEKPSTRIISKSNFTVHGDITFFDNTSALKETAYNLLNTLADYIQRFPGSEWLIEGYYDNSLEQVISKDLTLRRAKAVLKYFVEKGLPENAFKVEGMGSKNPIESNSTSFGQMKNRRIEIKRIK